MAALPPDLSRLGDELTAAAARVLEERRRRRRRLAGASATATAGVAAALVCFAVLTPGTPAPERQWAMRLTTMPLASRSLGAVVPSPPARPPAAVARRSRSARVRPRSAVPLRPLRLWE
jgi:hypothetical protein